MKLAILYEPTGGRPLAVCTLSDRGLLVNAARAAIQERRAEAKRLSTCDETLGRIANDDASRLQGTLRALIPELGGVTNGPDCGSPA